MKYELLDELRQNLWIWIRDLKREIEGKSAIG
jgi:hypothetical protein